MNDLFKKAFSLEQKVAIVTGGATGLGSGITKAFLSAGAKVIIIGRRLDILEKAAEEFGLNCFPIQFDITEFDKAPELISRVVQKFGRLDILVNNAGIQHKNQVENAVISEIKEELDVHVVGAFALTQASIPEMQKNETASVIFISSEAGFIGLTYLAGYSAAKAGVMGLVRNLASEVSNTGIRFNAIVPGWIETPMFIKSMGNDLERQKKVLNRTPLKRFGSIMDIGWAATYLASDASKFVTGSSIVVDGGALIGF